MSVRLRAILGVGVALNLTPLLPAVLDAQRNANVSPLPVAERFTITRATSEIDVNGRMSEAAWQDATRIPLAYEWFPGDNVAPPVDTECRVTYDTSSLYVGCAAHDPDPGAIRAHLADRDDLQRTVQDDHLVILLDPFNDVFARAIVQLQNVERNPDGYTFMVDPEERTLFTQFLFSYKVNPQTVAFVGYSDNRLGNDTVDLTQTGRTFFVKLGYALRP